MIATTNDSLIHNPTAHYFVGNTQKLMDSTQVAV